MLPLVALPGACAAALTVPFVARAYGWRRACRYSLAFVALTAFQGIVLAVLRRRAAPWRATAADLLTLGRAASGTVLLSLVAAGIRDRTGPAGWLGWLVALQGATVSDWLDGPLARRAGPTALGKALDIEADSWLTLATATAAVRWGDLPRWCLLPPLLRYATLVRALRRGALPAGGEPWWGRLAGTAQMALFLVALAPLRRRPPRRLLVALAALISSGRGAAQLVLLWRGR